MKNNSYIPLPEINIAPQKWCERETDPFFSFESQPLKAMPKLELKEGSFGFQAYLFVNENNLVV